MTKPAPMFTNNLINAVSPYLLQHAHNPVDWLEWGEQAFEKARRDDKPVFLSIGYSTCHWCHVMAHESFENEHIASILNEQFISIKVDREELPGVDALYMDFVQGITGGGGWPLSVFLTPDGKPFYGGTYFPPKDMYGRQGFENLLLSVAQAWSERKEELLKSADEITSFLQQQESSAEPLAIDRSILDNAAVMLEHLYDPQHGGFAGAPKFPQPGMLAFLMVYSRRVKDSKWLEMVQHTLDWMAAGGIHDHLGGGFHRYSVDDHWLVPHFEKMLYDQALMTNVYTQAFKLTGRQEYRETASDVIDYVLRDMTADGSGFYSAEDADSEGREGLFYVWTPSQLKTCLTAEQVKLVAAYYGVTENGNFEDGTSILHASRPLSEVAAECDTDIENTKSLLKQAEQKLCESRKKRIRPLRDEKIITGWNGLMISALACGGAAFAEPSYIQSARKSAEFILTHLYSDGRLKRYYHNGQVRELGILNDYAFFIKGLLDLYQVDFDLAWLKYAVDLAGQMLELFENRDTGGFYLTGKDSSPLVVRTRPGFDGAIPSGNSAAAMELLRLAELTGQKEWKNPAERVFSLFQEKLKKQGVSLTDMLCAVDFHLGPRSQVVIAAKGRDIKTQDILSEFHRRFLPRTVLLLRDDQRDMTLLEQIAGPVRECHSIDGKPTVYLCENFTCQKPITDVHACCRALDRLK